MAKIGDNNPRAFGDTVSLDAWRTPFDGKTGLADLHVQVVFSDGRIGGLDAPVRFRLQLRRAEVHVLRDAAQVLQIRSSSVKPGPNSGRERTVIATLETEVSTKTGVTLSQTPVAELGKQKKHILKQEVTTKDDGQSVTFVSMRVEDGYVFRVSSENELLEGVPWDSSTPILSYSDTSAPRRKGEPPELRVELRCRREDMRIYDIELTNPNDSLANYSANKVMAVEQYIKSELISTGFMVGDISDPFSEVILADVSPVEE